MVQTAKVTSKHQITIPKEVRERMGISSGDELQFEYDEGKLTVEKKVTENPFKEHRGKFEDLKDQDPDEIVSRARDRN